MRTLFSLVILLVATGATGCHKPDRCLSVCEERQKQLGCRPEEDCKTSCKKLHTAPSCQPELKKFEECFLAKPLDKWMCDAAGLPVVKEEECATERHIIMGCLEMGGNPPPAPPAKKP